MDDSQKQDDNFIKQNDLPQKETKVGENISSDDVVFIDEEEENNPSAVIKKLRKQLSVCQTERQQYLDGWQRMRADFVNSKKQAEEEKAQFVKYAEEGLVVRLLKVAETFDMAMGKKESWESAPKDWRVGVEYIYSEFISILSEYGLKTINPVGEKFNPQYHVSVSSEPVDKTEDDHKIVSVTQKGYSFKEKVLKPASVIIGEYKSNS